MPKQPTPQGISRLLKDAGFTRAVQTSRATLNHSFTSGFRVTKDRNDEKAVRVRHTFASRAASLSSGLHKAKLAAYAKTIAEAGWSVEAGEYELAVTAPKTED